MTLSRLRKKRKQILRIAKSHGARGMRVFGSVIRGQAKSTSDVDFLVDLDDDRTLLDLVGLTIALKGLLGQEVDVVTEASLHWYIRDKILQEAQPL